MIHSYPWYIQDWLLSRARSVLTLEQRGLYREILDILYNNEGVIDPHEDGLRRMCQAEKNEWKRSWPAVKILLDEIEGKWSHPKVRDTIEKLERYHSQRKSAGKSGAQRRWGNSSAIGPAIASTVAEPIRDDSLPQARTSSLPLPQARTISPPQSDLGFDASGLVSKITARHPKKSGLDWGGRRLTEVIAQAVNPAEVAFSIARKHELYCATEDWQKEGGKFAPKLGTWIDEHGYLDPDPVTPSAGGLSPQTQRALDRLKNERLA